MYSNFTGIYGIKEKIQKSKINHKKKRDGEEIVTIKLAKKYIKKITEWIRITVKKWHWYHTREREMEGISGKMEI